MHSPSLVLVIAQAGFAANDNHMFGVWRFVAIVPYQTRNENGSWELTSSLVNAAVLLFWMGSAAFFTVLRIGIHVKLGRSKSISIAKIFFSSFARALGNDAGGENIVGKSELFLVFVIGVFATLSSMLFTGALFEQLIAIEPPRQINSMAELKVSKLEIIDCWGNHNTDPR